MGQRAIRPRFLQTPETDRWFGLLRVCHYVHREHTRAHRQHLPERQGRHHMARRKAMYLPTIRLMRRLYEAPRDESAHQSPFEGAQNQSPDLCGRKQSRRNVSAHRTRRGRAQRRDLCDSAGERGRRRCPDGWPSLSYGQAAEAFDEHSKGSVESTTRPSSYKADTTSGSRQLNHVDSATWQFVCSHRVLAR